GGGSHCCWNPSPQSSLHRRRSVEAATAAGTIAFSRRSTDAGSVEAATAAGTLALSRRSTDAGSVEADAPLRTVAAQSTLHRRRVMRRWTFWRAICRTQVGPNNSRTLTSWFVRGFEPVERG